jgi:hypothetical protein
MSSVFYENSLWLQWVRATAASAFGPLFPLTQAGPRERRAMNKELADCGMRTPDVRPESACWWNVDIYGWTVTQVLQAGTAPTFQDPRGNGNRNVPLFGYIDYLGDRVFFDVGSGAHFSVYAPSVSIGVQAPAGAFRVGSDGVTNFPAASPIAPVNVTSAQVDGSVSACVRPITNAPITRTETRVLTASVDVPVPARARTLQIFQDTASLPAAPMNWVSDPTTGFDLGEVDFDTPTAPGRTSVLDVPAAATVLRTGAQARTVTLIWGLAL